eukprot:gene11208-12384_t
MFGPRKVFLLAYLISVLVRSLGTSNSTSAVTSTYLLNAFESETISLMVAVNDNTALSSIKIAETSSSYISTSTLNVETNPTTIEMSALTIETSTSTEGTSSSTVGTSNSTDGTSTSAVGTSSSTVGTSNSTVGTSSSTEGTSSSTDGTSSSTVGTSTSTVGTSTLTVGTSTSTVGTSTSTEGTSSSADGTSSSTVGTSTSTVGTSTSTVGTSSSTDGTSSSAFFQLTPTSQLADSEGTTKVGSTKLVTSHVATSTSRSKYIEPISSTQETLNILPTSVHSSISNQTTKTASSPTDMRTTTSAHASISTRYSIVSASPTRITPSQMDTTTLHYSDRTTSSTRKSFVDHKTRQTTPLASSIADSSIVSTNGVNTSRTSTRGTITSGTTTSDTSTNITSTSGTTTSITLKRSTFRASTTSINSIRSIYSSLQNTSRVQQSTEVQTSSMAATPTASRNETKLVATQSPIALNQSVGASSTFEAYAISTRSRSSSSEFQLTSSLGFVSTNEAGYSFWRTATTTMVKKISPSSIAKSSNIILRNSSVVIPGDGRKGEKNALSERTIIIISACSSGGFILLIVVLCCIFCSRRKTAKKQRTKKKRKNEELDNFPEAGTLDWGLKWRAMKDQDTFRKKKGNNANLVGLYGDGNNGFLSELDDDEPKRNSILDMSNVAETSLNSTNLNKANSNGDIPRCKSFSDGGLSSERSERSDESLIELIHKSKQSSVIGANDDNEDYNDEEGEEQSGLIDLTKVASVTSSSILREMDGNKKTSLTSFSTDSTSISFAPPRSKGKMSSFGSFDDGQKNNGSVEIKIDKDLPEDDEVFASETNEPNSAGQKSQPHSSVNLNETEASEA